MFGSSIFNAIREKIPPQDVARKFIESSSAADFHTRAVQASMPQFDELKRRAETGDPIALKQYREMYPLMGNMGTNEQFIERGKQLMATEPSYQADVLNKAILSGDLQAVGKLSGLEGKIRKGQDPKTGKDIWYIGDRETGFRNFDPQMLLSHLAYDVNAPKTRLGEGLFEDRAENQFKRDRAKMQDAFGYDIKKIGYSAMLSPGKSNYEKAVDVALALVKASDGKLDFNDAFKQVATMYGVGLGKIVDPMAQEKDDPDASLPNAPNESIESLFKRTKNPNQTLINPSVQGNNLGFTPVQKNGDLDHLYGGDQPGVNMNASEQNAINTLGSAMSGNPMSSLDLIKSIDKKTLSSALAKSAKQKALEK